MNTGLGTNPGDFLNFGPDYLNVEANPLSHTSLNVYIPQLEERGVSVSW